jgi:predicted lipoprotein
LAACFVLVFIGACTRTSDPVEHYATGTARPSSSGGKASAAGGSRSATQAGSASSNGSRAGGSNSDGVHDIGPGGEAGASSDGGGSPVEMPTDFGCGNPPVSSEPFTRRALRAAAADCAQWHYCRFEVAARNLAEGIDAYGAAPADETLDHARQAFARAMDLWSVNELFQLGPLSSQSESAGKDSYQGQGMRELIYAWPLSARCRVEEQAALHGYTKGMDKVLVAGRGLFALDYLLFYSGSDTACSATSATGKAWSALSEVDIVGGKLDYAAALGHDVVQQMAVLRAAWSPDDGNFRPRFVDATGYPNEQEAMKVLGWALSYVEHEVKDWKLGLPAGHAASAPVSEAEGAYSDLGTRAIRANLRGFRSLFQGCGAEGEGLGFDDWLSEAGHPELARDIVAAWQTAQAFADGAPPLSQATPAELEAFYQAVKALTDLLKNDLFGAGSPLGLTLPKGVEGDTD